MEHRPTWTAVGLGMAGIAACALGVGGFIWAISSNNLPWSPGQSARDFYREIGNAYSQGFVMGFFLCFFLVLLALTIGAHVRQRRAAAAVAGLDHPGPQGQGGQHQHRAHGSL